ncbi:MAG TPA: phytoene desaturase family protein [Anaerolineae bacterium]|nr:phytoene desaturase family protein [Anaerolineae bacterium]
MIQQAPILIIGAGIGGLSAAIHLAAAGHKVIIFEKNDTVGGKMSQHHALGYRWDRGPSVITMRHVFEQLFHTANRQLDDYLTLLPVDPLTRYFYADGHQLDATSNLAHMTTQIEQLNPRDVPGYLAYLAYAARIHHITGPVFIYDQPPTLKSFLKVPPPDWLRVDGLRTMNQAINRFVQDPHLRQLLGRFATYVGASPYQAPATLNVIAHVEMTQGVYYPQGGIYQIAHAFRQLAEELGVTIHTGTPVDKILIRHGSATALRLKAGDEVRGGAIISNLDVTTTRHHLLPSAYHQTPQDTSCSGFILLLGVNHTFPALAHHNIFFSADYPAEFHDIFTLGRPPLDPTIYLAITSKTDPQHAPAGAENWFILVNVPALNNKFDWAVHAPAYRDQILAALAARGFDARPHLAYSQILTPHDLQTETGAWRGALYGHSSNSPLAAFRRPHNRAPDLPGLYFTGGTTHPGGGVPMVTLSGRVAAHLLMQDLHSP